VDKDNKAQIIAELQRRIMPLQGYKPSCAGMEYKINLGPVNFAFPGSQFPLGAIHEFTSLNDEDVAASIGFVSGLLGLLMNSNGIVICIVQERKIFPHGLTSFGINPSNVIFIEDVKEKDVLWVFEEALKCNGIAGVIGEITNLSFTSSRRFQLAVEYSGVTGFIISKAIKGITNTACLTKWRIRAIPSINEDGLPGVGYPQWNVELLKVRNGKPGQWCLSWRDGQFYHIRNNVFEMEEWKRNTG
jgi:protein ImuA